MQLVDYGQHYRPIFESEARKGVSMKRSTVQVLSFMSGLTLAAVVIGVTLARSPSLRNEIENQVNSVLKTTRSLVNSYKSVASKSKTAVNLIKSDPEVRAESASAEAEQQAYEVNSQWDAVESSR